MGSATSKAKHQGSEDTELPSCTQFDLYPQQAPSYHSNGIEDILVALENSESVEEKIFASTRGAGVRSLVEDIQTWLDIHQHHPFRRQVHRLLLNLSTETKEIPRSLFLKGVQIESRDPTLFGAHADVFRGSWDGRLVALKRLRINDDAREDMYKRFCKEGLTWRQLEHPNIVPFYGVDGETFRDNSMLAMVSPWMKRGTIMKHIRSMDYNARRDRRRLMIEVAEGLNYLHQRFIAHGDLHGNNVLITDDQRACLTDFGLTVIGDLSRPQITSKSVCGASRWISPEQIAEDPRVARKRPAGDVFAFGRLCLAICIKQSPFHGKSDMAVLLGLEKDERPLRPSSAECHGFAISDDLWKLINDCWMMDPTKRPLMSHVLSVLHSFPS